MSENLQHAQYHSCIQATSMTLLNDCCLRGSILHRSLSCSVYALVNFYFGLL